MLFLSFILNILTRQFMQWNQMQICITVAYQASHTNSCSLRGVIPCLLNDPKLHIYFMIHGCWLTSLSDMTTSKQIWLFVYDARGSWTSGHSTHKEFILPSVSHVRIRASYCTTMDDFKHLTLDCNLL